MHKVAVLITGSPRFIEQGAVWWNLHLPKNIHEQKKWQDIWLNKNVFKTSKDLNKKK